MDIGIYTTPDVLEHKKKDGKMSEGNYCFWELSNIPSKVEIGDKFFFAVKGKWVGYFIIQDLDDFEIQFDSETWTDISPSDRKPFQGFTYNVPKA